jgi:hypothetical protein
MNIKDKLCAHIPASSAGYVSNLLELYSFSLKITPPRRSKLGDYRSPSRGRGHRISINEDLNPYSFLVTLIHEIAHLSTWDKYRNKCEAHGKEWQNELKVLLAPLLNEEVFPPDILSALRRYIESPSAASCTDHNLLRALRMHDNDNGYIHLEKLPEGTAFMLKGGRRFIKGELLKKRYKCTEIETGILYRISPLAEVIPDGEQLKLFA